MRARNLKPGFFKNEELAKLDPLARILFQGLWCMADREGRLEDRPLRIKAEVLPYDNCDIDGFLNQLHDAKLIVRYHNGGKTFIAIPTFKAHQNPHVREAPSVIPEPMGDAEDISGTEQEAENKGVATAADKRPDQHQKSTVPRTALAMPSPASSLNPSSLNPPSGIQQQQNNRDSGNGVGAVTQPAAAAVAPLSGEETPQERPELAKALDAAGIGNPPRREFLANPHCTAELVNRLENQRRQQGKRIGALVENIRAALRREAVRAEAKANRERDAATRANVPSDGPGGEVRTVTGAAAAYANLPPVVPISAEERRKILAPARASMRAAIERSAAPAKLEAPPATPPPVEPTAHEIARADARREELRRRTGVVDMQDRRAV